MSAADLVVIWSGEHRAWWSPNSKGYTDKLSDAGLYYRFYGEHILAGAGPEKRLELQDANHVG